ncbi:putative lipoprotein [Myxococcus hansupus]|uniref:Putative lipoprotein n=2 Tax=Pseudomyxococcus hansupus TaxID=1297742 RepID=A0A0H4WPX8_9BACT|nr:putative lipoprotein [Myxococcus hansupus]
MMGSMMTRTLTLTVLVTASALLSGCFNNAEAICEKRKECFSNSINVNRCADELDDWADDRDKDRRRDRLAQCADCLDRRTCAQIRTECIGACVSVP